MKCPPLPTSVQNGHAKLLSVQTHFYYQDQAVYLCDLGYTTLVASKTSRTIHCQNDGTWDAMPPNCTGMFGIATM